MSGQDKYILAEKLWLEITKLNISNDEQIPLTKKDLLNMINAFPKEDVTSIVHARWKEEYPQKVVGGKVPYSCECSQCGYLADYVTNYCPECGAKMDLDTDLNDTRKD